MARNEIVITARGDTGGTLRELWQARGLFVQLTWKEISVRYKQAAFGLAWAVGRPVITMVAMAIVFGRVAKLPSEGVPYPLWVLSATLFWTFFSTVLTAASDSLVGNVNLVTKVYFPRLMLPAAALGVNGFDLLLGFFVLAGVMAWYHFVPAWQALLLPLLALWCGLLAVGTGLWLAAINVRFRDVKHALPFVVQFGLYVSPVGFGLSALPAGLGKWILLNPVAGIIEASRWCLFGTTAPLLGAALLASAAWTAAILGGGLVYFRATERTFADVI